MRISSYLPSFIVGPSLTPDEKRDIEKPLLAVRQMLAETDFHQEFEDLSADMPVIQECLDVFEEVARQSPRDQTRILASLEKVLRRDFDLEMLNKLEAMICLLQEENAENIALEPFKRLVAKVYLEAFKRTDRLSKCPKITAKKVKEWVEKDGFVTIERKGKEPSRLEVPRQVLPDLWRISPKQTYVNLLPIKISEEVGDIIEKQGYDVNQAKRVFQFYDALVSEFERKELDPDKIHDAALQTLNRLIQTCTASANHFYRDALEFKDDWRYREKLIIPDNQSPADRWARLVEEFYSIDANKDRVLVHQQISLDILQQINPEKSFGNASCELVMDVLDEKDEGLLEIRIPGKFQRHEFTIISKDGEEGESDETPTVVAP